MAITDFDDILIHLGFGKWNLFHYIAISFAIFSDPGFIYAGIFVTPNLEFSCNIPPGIEANISSDNCGYTIIGHNDTDVQMEDVEQDCVSWSYRSNFTTTMTSDFDLVCDSAYLRPTFLTINMVGKVFGCLLNGYLVDKFGRKLSITICTIAVLVSVFGVTLMNNYLLILCMWFVNGLTSYPLMQTTYILSMEICDPKRRSVVGIVVSVSWAFGTIWLGILAYLIRDWRWLIRSASVPMLLLLICLWWVDESPRWLMVQGKEKEVTRVLKKAAKWNGVEQISTENIKGIIQLLNKQKSKTQKKASSCSTLVKSVWNQITVLVRTPEIRKRTLLTFAVFIVSATVFSGLTLNASNFDLDIYMYMVVGGISEIPAYTLPAPVIAKFGRVRPTALCYLLCGIAILVLAFIPSEPKWIVIALAMIGKFLISTAYIIIYLVASELFPTTVRMQAFGTASIMSTAGAMTTPFITDLVKSKTQKKASSSSTLVKSVWNQITVLVRTPEIRKRTLLTFAVFIVSATVFSGLTLNASNFDLDIYMYMVVGGISEIPAYTLPAPVIAKFGRVRPTALCYLLCGVAILVLAFIPSEPKWIVIALAMIGKFLISTAYIIIYLVASELFPTTVRMQAFGTASIMSTAGAMTTPFITDLVGNIYPWVPSIIFGSVSLLGAVAVIFLPETTDKHLPETVEQLEEEATRRKKKENHSENKNEELGLTSNTDH